MTCCSRPDPYARTQITSQANGAFTLACSGWTRSFALQAQGRNSGRYGQECGQRLLPEIYKLYNPLAYDEAWSLKVELGIDLREGGFIGLWQA